ncbi:MBL fold metallo-hydrolase [Simiduia sp. 21SJ11W-1]|uniref:MBL fold metallo-hydrolase RNA specificity domain-containing protein n=1 Tax=Simiduia sp. 21SJ11W-1 TaxID=2909669 RepID=UPI00209FE865|nr:MBL fold metallo-hydrolase [Simiduia sp. 21SJ11W-1]UTA49552.1 MBL fold metallo-hydrolase [Simiduia sp. 21SJ11W-1]
MKLIHHGARAGVTGSCHELFIMPAASLLVDCGLFQGEAEGRSSNLTLGFDCTKARCLVVTHCHIDHVGRIPALLAAGFAGNIYCTQATALLLPEVLEDALKLGVTRDEAVIERFLAVIQSRLVPLAYGQTIFLPEFEAQAVTLRFECAGHIMGSAYAVLDVPAEVVAPHAGEKPRATVVFSGDLGAPHTPLLPDPTPPPRADVLVVESTYGDREHEQRATRQLRLEALVRKTLANGGTTLIPAFSIGRTQELLYELEAMFARLAEGRESTLSRLPVIVDSPMAAKFTKGYEQLKRLWDEEAKGRLASGRNPLDFHNLVIIDSHAQHEALLNRLAQHKESAIVIAASGMCTGGRMLNYLKALIGEPSTDIIFVGYQAAGTAGRAIQIYGPKGGWVELDHERFNIRAAVHTLGGYSAHADRSDLLAFCKAAQPAYVRVVHGEPYVQRAFAGELRAGLGCLAEAACDGVALCALRAKY